MAVQPHRFLVDGGLVCKDGGLGDKAAFLNVPILQKLLQAGIQAVAVCLDAALGGLLDLTHQRFHVLQAAFHIRLQLFALSRTHGHKGIDGLIGDALHILPQRILVGGGGGLGQHIGKAGQHAHRHIVFQVHALHHGGQRGAIALRQPPVHRHHRVGGGDILDGQGQFHLAAADSGRHQLFQLILQKKAGAGQPRGIFQIAGIHAAQLHFDIPPVKHCPGAAIAGHTKYHSSNTSFIGVCIPIQDILYYFWPELARRHSPFGTFLSGNFTTCGG